jgi:hypothetical protein
MNGVKNPFAIRKGAAPSKKERTPIYIFKESIN